jgi:hypothetical protein
MRLSILLTYLLGKSPLFMAALRLVRNMAGLATEALKPLWAMMGAAISAMAWALQPLASAVWLLCVAVQQLVMALLWGPLLLLGWVRDALLPLLSPLIVAVRSASATLQWGGGMARGVAGAAPAVASSAGAVKRSGWLLLSSWARLEALHLQQALVLRAVRSAQAIVRFWVAAATTLNQHRVSLLLQLRHQQQRLQRRAAATRVGAALMVVARPLLAAHRRRQQLRAVPSGALSSDGSLLLAPLVAAADAQRASAHLGGGAAASMTSEVDSSPADPVLGVAPSTCHGSSAASSNGEGANSSSSSIASPDLALLGNGHDEVAGSEAGHVALGTGAQAARFSGLSHQQLPALAAQVTTLSSQQLEQYGPSQVPQALRPPHQSSWLALQHMRQHRRRQTSQQQDGKRPNNVGPQLPFGASVLEGADSAVPPASRGPSAISASSVADHAFTGSAFLSALREAANAQQQSRRRWGKGRPAALVPHVAPSRTPGFEASQEGVAVISAWDRATAGLRGVKWLRSVKSHPV